MREHLLPKSIKQRSFNSVNNKVSRSEIRVNLRLATQKATAPAVHRGRAIRPKRPPGPSRLAASPSQIEPSRAFESWNQEPGGWMRDGQSPRPEGGIRDCRSRPRLFVTRKDAPQSACAAVAETDQSPGLDDRELGFEPGPARRDFDRVRLLVDAFLSSRLPFEVLHDIGHVDLTPIDSGFLQAGVEQAAGGADKRAPFDVFPVARLLAHQKRRAPTGPSPKTVWVPRFHSGHARQPAAARRSEARVGRRGMSGAAVCVAAIIRATAEFAPLFVLLTGGPKRCKTVRPGATAPE